MLSFIPTFMSSSSRTQNSPTIINRIARHRYHFLSTHECGIELLGTEIKSIRAARINLRDGFIRPKHGQLYLHNVHISPHNTSAPFFNHDPLRVRRLLLHKAQILRLEGRVADKGLTIIPTRAYFTDRGWFKLEIALARGKQLHDKRDALREKDLDRDMRRIVKNVGI